MHRYIALGVCALLVVVGLLATSSDVAVAANKGNYPTYGWVYGVSSVKSWEDTLPKGREGQDKYDRENMIETHYVFEASNDTSRHCLNQQGAMHKAIRDGWQIVGMDDGRVLMFHPKRTVWDHDRNR